MATRHQGWQTRIACSCTILWIKQYPQLVQTGCEIKHFCHTADIIEQLDLVVTIDTSTVHLALSMGKQTILILPTPEDWRWVAHKEKPMWYDEVTILKQTSPTNWQSVLERLATEIKQQQQEKNALSG